MLVEGPRRSIIRSCISRQVWRSSREIQALARSVEENGGAAKDREGIPDSLAWTMPRDLHALAELFPGQPIEEIILADLLRRRSMKLPRPCPTSEVRKSYRATIMAIRFTRMSA
jgi:hypothetical protein